MLCFEGLGEEGLGGGDVLLGGELFGEGICVGRVLTRGFVFDIAPVL